MHNCFACSFESPTQRRRNKKTSAGCMKNKNKAKSINIRRIDFQLIRELRVVLDRAIVDRYLEAKRIIGEILRSDRSKCDYRKSYSSGYQRVNSSNYDESFHEVCTIKDEISDEKSPIILYDDEGLINNAEVQIVEIPFDSNIVLNPLNKWLSFTQIDASFIRSNEADAMNANICDLQQSAALPKYIYNPMNNIITSTQVNDDSDDSNNNQPDVVPADVQFSPGEYTMEDSFLNDNYNVVNTFALESTDMESDQNTLALTEQSSKQLNLTIQLSAGTTTEDIDSPKYETIDNSKASIKPSIKKHEQKIKTELVGNACAKCSKKFKLLHYLRKHELTCGMNFYYNCLFCAKSSMLSCTIKCHMMNCHAEQLEICGMKEAMQNVIKRRKENKEKNVNVLLSKENQVSLDVKRNLASMNNLAKIMKNDKQEPFSNVQPSYIDNKETDIRDINFKPSKEYVDVLCSNCNIYIKNVKSGIIKCCPNCQSSLIYKCAVCQKCFSKYLSICGHVKCHSKPNLRQIVTTNDKHYCGYCRYETTLKIHLLQHLLEHTQEKSMTIKHEYSG